MTEEELFELVNEILNYLTEECYFKIICHRTHRSIAVDGFFELEFELEGCTEKNIYLTHYVSFDKKEEDEWISEGYIEPAEIKWGDEYNEYTYKIILEDIFESKEDSDCLSEELFNKLNEAIEKLNEVGLIF